MSASSFSPALISWAEHQGRRLADQFLADDIEERGDAAAYFNRKCGPLLRAALRPQAEQAFLERLLAVEAST